MNGVARKDDMSAISRQRTCLLGPDDCTDEQFEIKSLQEHYLSERHQKALISYAQRLSESSTSGSFQTDADIEERQSSFLQHYDRLHKITQNIEINHDEVAQLDDELYRSPNQNTNLPEQVNDVQTEILQEKAYLDAISIGQNVVKQDILTLKQQIENDNVIIKQEPDGMMVWKITKVLEKIYDAQSERQTSIYSPPFNTSPCGYRVCVRLYLNGDGSARGSHMSIFVVILRGPYDSLLKWPFPYRVSFCLCDQRTMIETNGTVPPKHIVESFRPDINSTSFQRPPLAINIASGVPKFFLLSELKESTNESLYILNDTMYIKTFIDFIGLPRAMLPFVFNINVAFPVHIQQKLIADELKRRREQNTN